MTTFTDLNLNEKILSALEKKGYTTPTPIQLQSIPHLLEGKDLLGIAQTGTGKTAAFALPIIHNLAKSNVAVKNGYVRTLILTPTRELASQIAENIELYGAGLGLRHTVIFGGVNERPQIAAMQRGVDILIATPGRLLDLINQGYIRFMQLEVFVLDEADRMLDMGFINDIKKIITKLPAKRQTLFFSATMPSTISGLAQSILTNPVKVEVTPQSTTVERIDQKLFEVAKGNKPALLKNILKQDDVNHVLIFSKTKHGSNKVVEYLEKHGIQVAAIHGNKSQSAREKALASFRSGEIKVLVATDIAARGIDVPGISHVINYDLPNDPESYVHRIGRTARAGKEGVAITLCDPSEYKLLQAVEKAIKMKIPVDTTHAYHGVESSRPDISSEPRRTSNSRPTRPANTSGREERKYGFAVNKSDKVSEGRGRRDDSRSDSRSGRDDSRRDSRSEPRVNREEVQPLNNDNRKPFERKPFRKKPEDKKPFGFLNFGGWFKGKKPEGKDGARRPSDRDGSRRSSDSRSSETRDRNFDSPRDRGNDFEGRERRPARSSDGRPSSGRSGFGSRSSSGSSSSSSSRSGSSFGNRSSSGSRSGSGSRISSGRSSSSSSSKKPW
jgi:ATP-dependent RNA helicase RhlE